MGTKTEKPDRSLAVVSVILTALTLALKVLEFDPKMLGQRAQGYLVSVLQYAGWLEIPLVLCVLALLWRLRALRRKMANDPTASACVIFPNRDDDAAVSLLKRLLNEAKSIDAVGIANSRLTSEVLSEFYHGLLVHRQGKMRILFLNPRGKQISRREKEENRAPGSLRDLVKHNIDNVRNFLKSCSVKFEKAARAVEVRLYDDSTKMNLIIIDDKTLVMHAYGMHSRGREVPLIVAQDAQEDVLRWYREQFELLWKAGTPLELSDDVHEAMPGSQPPPVAHTLGRKARAQRKER